MGLDFDKADAQWSYSGFNRFRTKLAASAGITLDEMEGFSGFDSGHKGVSWDCYTDDIKPLLNHSDCEGELTAEECKQVAPRLRELVAGWKDDVIDHDYVNALNLAEGMEECAAKGESLMFC